MGFDDEFYEECPNCGNLMRMKYWRQYNYECDECRAVNLSLRRDDEDNPRYTVAYDDSDLLDQTDNDEWEDV